jgi:hypothetical protein
MMGLAGAARAELAQVEDDPLGFIIKAMRVFGVIFLAVACLCGVIGYYLKGESVRSKNEAGTQAQTVLNAWGNVGAQFNNLLPLDNPLENGNASITGGNVLSDLSNLGSDIVNDVEGVAGDLWTGVQDLGKALEDIPPAIWAMGTALGTTGLTVPSLLWNELVYALGGSIANVMLWWFPYALAAGIGLLLGSMALSMARSTWRITAMEAYKDQQRIWAARQRKKIWEPLFARAFRNPAPTTGKPEPVPLPAEAVNGPPPEPGGVMTTLGPSAEPVPTPAPIVGQEADATKPSGTTNSTPEGAVIQPEGPEAPDVPDRPSPLAEDEEEEEYEGPATTEDVENVLGNYPDAKTRMKILLRQGEPREPTSEELTEERIAILSAPLEA